MYDVNDTTILALASSDHPARARMDTQTQTLTVNLGMTGALREPSSIKRREQRLSKCIPRGGGGQRRGRVNELSNETGQDPQMVSRLQRRSRTRSASIDFCSGRRQTRQVTVLH